MVNFGEKAKIKRQEIWIQVVVVLLQLYLPPPTHICTFLWLRHWKLFKITITFMAGQGQSRLEVETRQEIKTVFRIKRLPREG